MNKAIHRTAHRAIRSAHRLLDSHTITANGKTYHLTLTSQDSSLDREATGFITARTRIAHIATTDKFTLNSIIQLDETPYRITQITTTPISTTLTLEIHLY